VLVRILGGENISKIGNESVRKLIRSSGVGAIRIDEVGYFIFPISLSYCMMEKGGVSVTCNCPVFLGSLNVVGFFFSQEVLVLVM
jgi:hypothetical protein